MVKAPKHGRPLSVTLTAWGVFLLGLVNGWRAASLGRQLSLQLELAVAVDPRLRLVLAGLWAILFVAAAVALWQRQPVARRAVPLFLLIYAVYQFGLPVLFARAAEAQRNWPVVALQYVLAILFATWALNRAAAKRYFGKETI
ncbi:MAG: hypothetical protein L0332_07690 [Chloroflexi bacterium]|nr:hypothetical protein [Chloroflexota bacterium]MCI0575245.1 hypothetical protein [Chloroflexota bacterium]MCI0648834.1 hypothetical protein [Chloroflexota bacterium]MCI0726589.1 hypothetical protein [Chloroflexota bacterium]